MNKQKVNSVFDSAGSEACTSTGRKNRPTSERKKGDGKFFYPTYRPRPNCKKTRKETYAEHLRKKAERIQRRLEVLDIMEREGRPLVKSHLHSNKVSKIKKHQPAIYSLDESDCESLTNSEKGFNKKRSLSTSSSSSDTESELEISHENNTNKENEYFISAREELEKIRLSRFHMAKFFNLPIFSKAIVGCFVRIGIGNNQERPMYRVAEIVDIVETEKIYNLENIRTNLGLRLRYGNQYRVFHLEYISNSCFSDSEFQKWMKYCSNRVPLPTVEHIQKKQKDIYDLLYYQNGNKDKKNFIIAKTLLHKECGTLLQTKDDNVVKPVRSNKSELEEKAAISLNKRKSNIGGTLYICERNQKNGMKNVEETILADKFERNGINTEDPFIRKRTRPTRMMTYSYPRQEIMSSDFMYQSEEERK